MRETRLRRSSATRNKVVWWSASGTSSGGTRYHPSSVNSSSHSSSRHSSSSAASSTKNRSTSPRVIGPGIARLLGGSALRRRPVGAVGRAALALHQRIPAPPERAHLQFVLARRLVAAHAARDVRPRQFAPGGEAALAAFEPGDVVRRAEAGRTEKRDEILVALLPQFWRVVARQRRPGIDLDVIGRQRIPGADRVPIRNQDQVWENEEVAVEISNAAGVLRAELLDETGADRGEFVLRLHHDRRRTLRVLDHAVPAAQRQADPPLPARAGPLRRVGAEIVKVLHEIAIVRRDRVIAVDRVLDQ